MLVVLQSILPLRSSNAMCISVRTLLVRYLPKNGLDCDIALFD